MSVLINERRNSKNLFKEEINKLIIYQKNEIIKKAIIIFLSGKYEDTFEYMYDVYPEFSLNEDSNALLLMCHIHIRLKHLDSAIDFIRQSIKKLKKDDYFVHDSLSIIYFLKNDYKNRYVSLMAQYTPCGNLENVEEINRRITAREYSKVCDYAEELGFENVFLQKLSSADKNFIPAFDFSGIM